VWWLLYHYNRPFWNWVVFDTVGMDPSSHWGEAVHFLFYDVSKIVLLLTGVIFVVTVLRSFMSVDNLRPHGVSVVTGRERPLAHRARCERLTQASMPARRPVRIDTRNQCDIISNGVRVRPRCGARNSRGCVDD